MVPLGPGAGRVLLSQPRAAGLSLLQGRAPRKHWPITVGVQSRAGLCWEGMGASSCPPPPQLLSPPILPQNWLTESAKLIAQSGRTVEWVTPLGLPIVQPYYRSKPTVVSTWCEHLLRRETGGLRADRAQQVGIMEPQGLCVQPHPPLRARSVWVAGGEAPLLPSHSDSRGTGPFPRRGAFLWARMIQSRCSRLPHAAALTHGSWSRPRSRSPPGALPCSSPFSLPAAELRHAAPERENILH